MLLSVIVFRARLQSERRIRVHHQARSNVGMSLIVEQGITHDTLHGSVMAWKFLAGHKVPDAVILRVLAEPSKRRDTDHLFAGQVRPPVVVEPAGAP